MESTKCIMLKKKKEKTFFQKRLRLMGHSQQNTHPILSKNWMDVKLRNSRQYMHSPVIQFDNVIISLQSFQ